MSHTYLLEDPHPLERRGKNATMTNDEPQLIEEADPEHQETLVSTNEVCLFFPAFSLRDVQRGRCD